MIEKYSSKDIQVIDLVSMNFLELIKAIEERPYYLSESNIQCLESFINGWFVGRGYNADDGVMQGFQQFIESRFKSTTTHGWASIIYFYSTNSQQALKYFFELFNEYTAANVTT